MATDAEYQAEGERDKAIKIAADIATAYAGCPSSRPSDTQIKKTFELIYDSILTRIRGEAQASST